MISKKKILAGKDINLSHQLCILVCCLLHYPNNLTSPDQNISLILYLAFNAMRVIQKVATFHVFLLCRSSLIPKSRFVGQLHVFTQYSFESRCDKFLLYIVSMFRMKHVIENPAVYQAWSIIQFLNIQSLKHFHSAKEYLCRKLFKSDDKLQTAAIGQHNRLVATSIS